MTGRSPARTSIVFVLLVLGSVMSVSAFELENSLLADDMHKLKYSFALSGDDFSNTDSEISAFVNDQDARGKAIIKKKSPLKAFALSAAVPGLGQYYYGSRVKPFVFLGAEITAWVLHVKWHNDGDDATDVYEAFNDQWWHRDRYEDYISWAYRVSSDQSITGLHHLPDTKTQQYYEMTGKYDQFLWGWDDAVLPDGTTWDDRDSTNTVPISNDPNSTPYSAKRFYYESLRHDANQKYGRATKMIAVSMANRLISAFEAYFVVRHHNSKTPDQDNAFARLNVSAELKTFHTAADTPFLNVAYKF
ncbi:MAG: hypothetical protein DRP45_02600 [Candidatus Zixiibacteriota bacterium]|nr:MAG: hypothetical protein DRP45_02600 [candidate division Zixibacteria bacterium]